MKKLCRNHAELLKTLLSQKILKTMRNILILLFLTTFQVFADNAYSQITTISLDLDRVTVKSVLQEIEKNSDFFFLYNSKLIDDVKIVDAQFEDEKIGEILAQVFEETNIGYVIVDRQIILSPQEYLSEITSMMQPLTITGTVTDENGEPLPGLTVTVKGTTRGVITGMDGGYTIEVDDPLAILVFSYVGYFSQEVEVGNQATIDLNMQPDVLGLEEVVVIGYGTMKKSDLTGAVVSADIEAFRESSNISIMQSLQGTVPGLTIGQISNAGEDPDLLIRGRNSFVGANNFAVQGVGEAHAPLIVLDGIIFRGSLVDINPADIESVDVLKDASSAAVYGASSANGVIIITTKKGGDFGKPIFNYSGHYTIQNPSNTPEIHDREGYLNKLRDVYWEDGHLAPDYTQPNPDFDPTAYWIRDRMVDGYNSGTEFDWLDEATQTGHIQEHNLSMRGKTELTSYFISTGYTDQLGWIMNDKYKRYNVRMNVENKILDWLKIGVQSFFTSGDYSGVKPKIDYCIVMSPMVTPWDDNGELVRNPDGGPATNPFFQSDVDDFNKRMNLMANFYTDIDVPFIEGLSYRMNYSHNYLAGRHYYFSEYDYNYLGQSYKENTTQYNWTLDNILTYSRTFNNHGINLTLMAGREERANEYSKAESKEFINSALGYNNLSVGGIPLVYSGAWDESSLYYMGRFHYNYGSKYLATFTIRRDGFSGFSEEQGKFGTFPSAALAWVVSEENFMKDNQGLINLLKFRASYGQTGNRGIGRYGTLSRVEASPGYVFGDGSSPYITQRISRLGNAGLSWETTTAFNVGVDFALLDRRIRGNAEYYNSDTRDILFQVSIPQITGYNSLPDNIGKVHNSGIELSLTGTIISRSDFSWNMTVNYWKNRNEIVSIIGLDNDEDGIEDDLVTDGLFIGEPMGVVYGFVEDGLYQIGDTDIPDGWYPGQHRFKDLNGDGLITADHDRTITGYKDPAYQFSINNHFQYKNWSLRILINSAQGGDNMYYGWQPANQNCGENAAYNNSFVWDWWTPSNPDAEWPQLYYRTPVSPQHWRYQQRSFVRLQDVLLSYTFDKGIVNKFGFQNLKVYVSGKNLYTWTNWQGWDPETAIGLLRQLSAPVMKGFTFGLDFSF